MEGERHHNTHKMGKMKQLVGRLRSSSKSKASASSSRTSSDSDHAPASSINNPAAAASLELWNAAYDALRDHRSSAGLVTAYEAIISQELPDQLKLGGATSFRGRSADERLQLLTRIMATGLQKRRGSKGSQGDDAPAPKVLEQAKKAVEQVCAVYPSTAVAWAGICTLTPLLVDPILREDRMRRGIVHVAGRVTWYMHLANLLLVDSWTSSELFESRRQTTRDALITLYRQVLEVEMNCVCATAGSWNVAAKNVVNWSMLESLAADIEAADAEIRSCVEDYGTPDLKSLLLVCDADVDLGVAGVVDDQLSAPVANGTATRQAVV